MALDQPSALTRSGPATRVYLTCESISDIARVAALSSVRVVREERPGHYAIDTDDAGALLVELTTWLKQEEILPQELRVGGESLEDVFCGSPVRSLDCERDTGGRGGRPDAH